MKLNAIAHLFLCFREIGILNWIMKWIGSQRKSEINEKASMRFSVI